MKSSRRNFLKSVAAASAAIPAAAVPADALARADRADAACATARQPYVFFTPAEAEFVEAAVARLIPADELGPGAREADVALFIDRQLAGAFGTMARGYGHGPWQDGTPQQGYQSRLTPQAVYRTAIREVDAHCTRQHGMAFVALAAERQDEVLHALEAGEPALESVAAAMFFEMLWDNTVEGFFADPMYGGNRDKIGWRLVGFPGVAAAYLPFIEKHDVPYRVQPVSIADVQQRRVPLDAHGHPVHPSPAGKGGK